MGNNRLTHQAMMQIAKNRPEGTTTVGNIIAHLANVNNGYWLAQRFTKITMKYVLKSHELNQIQKKNILVAIELYGDKVEDKGLKNRFFKSILKLKQNYSSQKQENLSYKR